MKAKSSPQVFPSLNYHNYSLVGDGNNAWSTLASLKVFIPATREPTIDLFDVVIADRQSIRSCQKTFTSTEDLEDYINSSTNIGGTRYL